MAEYANRDLANHRLKIIVNTREPLMVALRGCVLVLLAILSLGGLRAPLYTFSGATLYEKDVMQEYLLAKAVLKGVDPYLPLSSLGGMLVGPAASQILPHPTPHPPPIGLVFLPLALLPYEQAAILWLVLSLVCAGASLYLLASWMGCQPRILWIILLTLPIAGWAPLRDDLMFGQLNTPLLLLLVGAWLTLRAGRSQWGGVLLGCVLALKLMAWPVVIFLLLRKNWRAVLAAAITVALLNLGAVMLMGLGPVLYYYLKLGAIISPIYRSIEYNFSISAIGWRTFAGTESPAFWAVSAPPLIPAPALAPYAAYALPVALLAFALLAAQRARRFDTAFAVMICATIVVNPVAWIHYLTLAAIPLAVAVRGLATLDYPRLETLGIISATLLLSITRSAYHELIRMFGILEVSPGNIIMVPALAAHLTFVPLLALLALLWLIVRVDRLPTQERLNVDG